MRTSITFSFASRQAERTSQRDTTNVTMDLEMFHPLKCVSVLYLCCFLIHRSKCLMGRYSSACMWIERQEKEEKKINPSEFFNLLFCRLKTRSCSVVFTEIMLTCRSACRCREEIQWVMPSACYFIFSSCGFLQTFIWQERDKQFPLLSSFFHSHCRTGVS